MIDSAVVDKDSNCHPGSHDNSTHRLGYKTCYNLGLHSTGGTGTKLEPVVLGWVAKEMNKVWGPRQSRLTVQCAAQFSKHQ